MTHKFNKTELEIMSRLLGIANQSDFFIDHLPSGCKSLEDVWKSIDRIELKIKANQTK